MEVRGTKCLVHGHTFTKWPVQSEAWVDVCTPSVHVTVIITYCLLQKPALVNDLETSYCTREEHLKYIRVVVKKLALAL